MESRNPVFGRSEQFARGGHATFDTRTPSAGELQDMYGAPSATTADTRRMTIDDVVMRTASLFAVLLATAGTTFYVVKPQSFGLILIAALVGFGLAMWISFSKTIRPAAMFAYAAVEGVFVGGISYFYEARWEGVVVQAVLGTLATFAAMLALYRFNVIRATPKFQRILIMAGAGYLVFSLVNVAIALISGNSVYNVGGLGLIVSAFGVVLAALFLVLDFDYIEQGIRNGLPERFAWTAAFGLVVTLVWLYLEILRLLAILRGDN
ncbi:MAG TPA: Bax inhibitor-1/YccA family protein [Kineosporiaceae bacterium]|nr:Bax inhibitor-1/YccA family protein [Kineosporiaceae bacterium]